jgi:hypothetical protein
MADQIMTVTKERLTEMPYPTWTCGLQRSNICDFQ